MVLCWKTFTLVDPFLSGYTFQLLDCDDGTHSDTNGCNTERGGESILPFKKVNNYFVILLIITIDNQWNCIKNQLYKYN
jgi:hypothetical protein